MGSVSDSTTLWSAHKAFIRGIIIQLCSQAKWRKMQRINQITKELAEADSLDQTNPSQAALRKLLALCLELRSLLLDSFERNFCRPKD